MAACRVVSVRCCHDIFATVTPLVPSAPAISHNTYLQFLRMYTYAKYLRCRCNVCISPRACAKNTYTRNSALLRDVDRPTVRHSLCFFNTLPFCFVLFSCSKQKSQLRRSRKRRKKERAEARFAHTE